jgi:excisionase family DNA binding protein
MTLEKVASYLRVHPSSIYRLLKMQQLPAFKVGSDWRFNLELIDRWRCDAGSESGAVHGFHQAGAKVLPATECD